MYIVITIKQKGIFMKKQDFDPIKLSGDDYDDWDYEVSSKEYAAGFIYFALFLIVFFIVIAGLLHIISMLVGGA